MGAATGFVVGGAMVKWRWVDCENWDLFSVMQDRHRKSRDELNEEAFTSEEGQAKLASHRNQILAQFRNQLAAGDAEALLPFIAAESISSAAAGKSATTNMCKSSPA